MDRRRVLGRLLVAFAAVAIVGVRLWQLGADPYPRLDWSAGLLTDEGFYIHNARNVALFGVARTDAFNNMLLSPLLHAVQVVWFKLLGVGAIQARLVSVLASVAALFLMYRIMLQWFGRTAAWATTLFLGLDHSVFLYNRMALMDTPAMLGGVVGLWCFSSALRATHARRSAIWYALCGLALGVTLANRSLCLFMVPAPVLGIWLDRRQPVPVRRLHIGLALLGLVVVLGAVGVAWTLPNRAEIGSMTRYYRVVQLQPKSAGAAAGNVAEGLFGDRRGAAPYWFRHLPVALLLALLGCLGVALGVRPSEEARPIEVYLLTWFAVGWLLLSFVSYSPSRYYVSLYPAMAAIGGVALSRMHALVDALATEGRASRLLRAALAWFLGYHAILTVVHHRGVLGPWATVLCLYGVPTAIAALAYAWRVRLETGQVARVAFVTLALLWMVTNGYWIADWARSMAFTQRNASLAIASLVPEGGVVLGDVAPGVCLDNRLRAVNVIPGLCNDGTVVERWIGRPRAIAILDGRWKEGWWRVHYPELVSPPKAALRMRVLRWDVGVYLVDAGSTLVPGATQPAADRS